MLNTICVWTAGLLPCAEAMEHYRTWLGFAAGKAPSQGLATATDYQPDWLVVEGVADQFEDSDNATRFLTRGGYTLASQVDKDG